MGFLEEEDVREATELQSKQGGKLGEVLINMGLVTEADVVYALGEQLGMGVADLDAHEVQPSVIDLVPSTIAVPHRICPVEYEDGVLIVALADPMNPTVLDDLRFMLNLEIKGAVAIPEAWGEQALLFARAGEVLRRRRRRQRPGQRLRRGGEVRPRRHGGRGRQGG